MTATVAEVTEVSVEDDDLRRPLMTFGNIAWMNLGFFGVQYSFAMTQTAVNRCSFCWVLTRTTCRSSTSPARSPAC